MVDASDYSDLVHRVMKTGDAGLDAEIATRLENGITGDWNGKNLDDMSRDEMIAALIFAEATILVMKDKSLEILKELQPLADRVRLNKALDAVVKQ